MSTSRDISKEQELIGQQASSGWRLLVDRFSYKALVGNVPYLAFLAILCVYYISTNKKAVEVQRELNSKNEVLKELRWEYMDVKSQMMFAQMETEVMKNAADIGLMPMTLPPFEVTEEQKQK